MDKANELSKYSTNNEDKEKRTNPHNENQNQLKHRLIYLLVQFTCEERLDQCDDEKLVKFQNWLEILHAGDRSPAWHGSRYVDLPEIMNLDAHIPQEIPNSEDEIILVRITAYFGHIINWLVKGKWDLNYPDEGGLTFLHRFMYNLRPFPIHHRSRSSENRNIGKLRKFIKGMLELNAPLYAMASNGFTPFDAAANYGNIVIVQTMVDHLVDTNVRNGNGETALYVVVNRCVDWKNNYKDGYLDLVRTLLAKNANVNAKNSKGWTPVHLAAEKFQPEMLRLFAYKGANFHERTNDDETPLELVCKSTVVPKDPRVTIYPLNSIETFDYLVSQGCNVEVINKDGSTLLHFAAEFRSVEVVERLIAFGLNVDARTKERLLTPLYLAAKSDKLDSMKALVKAGADVNAEAADGSTPIFMSAMRGSYESMRFLMDEGADLHRRDSLMGFTLLHMAAIAVELRPQFKAPPDTQTGDRLKKLEVLMDKGLDVNDLGIYGVTPLQLAAVAPNFDAVKLLLDRGAKVELQSSQWTALHSASLMKDPNIVKILLANGADVTRRAGIGRWTPLHLILMYGRHFGVGHYSVDVDENDARLSCPINTLWTRRFWPSLDPHIELMTMLIDNGADVNAECALGRTSLHTPARNFCSEKQLRKLLDSGARVYLQDKEGKLPLHYAWENVQGVEKVRMLLDFGADINDDDSSEMIVNYKHKLKYVGDAEQIRMKEVAIQHAIKLKLVGLPVTKIYEPLISASEFADFYEQCSKETTTLVNHRDDDGFSLYDFLKMNPKRQYHWIKRISDRYGNLEEIFPNYASLIRAACCESADRKPLLELARIAWAQITRINLPEVCVEHVLSYLSNRWLKVLTTAVEGTATFEDKRIVFAYKLM